MYSCEINFYVNIVTSFKVEDLTFDHVLPKSRGGQTTWDNVVTCCRKCNKLKGKKLLIKKTSFSLYLKPVHPK